jgi:hypothetical protein
MLYLSANSYDIEQDTEISLVTGINSVDIRFRHLTNLTNLTGLTYRFSLQAVFLLALVLGIFWLLYHYKLIHVASFRYLRHRSRLLCDKSRDVHARRVAFKTHATGHGSTVSRVFIRRCSHATLFTRLRAY